MITVPQVERMSAPTLSRHNSEGHMPAPAETFRATQKSLKALAARFSPGTPKVPRHEQQDARRATLATITPNMGAHANPSSTSLSSVRSEPHTARSEPTMSPMSQHRASFSVADKRRQTQPPSQHRNIDYLSFASDPLATYAMNHNGGIKSEVSASDWERLLSSLDSGQTNIYDNIYGGPPAEALLDAHRQHNGVVAQRMELGLERAGAAAAERAELHGRKPHERRRLWQRVRLWRDARQRQGVRQHHDSRHEHADRAGCARRYVWAVGADDEKEGFTRG
jgi:hypothetical protein